MSRESLHVLLGTLLAMSIAFAVRAFWITHPALWQDEIFTVLYARNDLGHLLSLTRTSDIHPPFFYILVKGVAGLFGEGDGSALRLISAVASALSAGLLFFWGRYRFGIAIAVLATLFFILLPVNVHYGRELRTYALLTLLLLLATVFFIEMSQAEHSRRTRWLFAVGYGVSLAISFHLHYSALVYFLLFGTASFALRITGADRTQVRFALGATMAAAVLCLPQAFHFFWARAHVSGDFWIEATNWQNFYGVSLGLYPFSFWAKPFVYSAYVVGTFFLWKQDRRIMTIASIFLVGGPLTVALIGLVTPAYLVRTIQVFATLSPFLLAFFVLGLPRLAVVPAAVMLVVVHVMTIESSYPSAKEHLAVDRIEPLLAEHDPETVYYFAPLSKQFDLRSIPRDKWTAVSLGNLNMRDSIEAKLSQCAEQRSCGPNMVMMERAPRFQIKDGRAWMAWMDTISTRYNAEIDQDIDGLRVMTIK